MKTKYLCSFMPIFFWSLNLFSQGKVEPIVTEPPIIKSPVSSSEIKKSSAFITSPKDNSSFAGSFEVTGIAKNIPDTCHLWLVIKPRESIGWWPQYSEITLKKDGSWSGLVTIGGDKDKLLDIHLVLAYAEANKIFYDYLETSIQKKSFPVLHRPDGTISLTHITVIKTD